MKHNWLDEEPQQLSSQQTGGRRDAYRRVMLVKYPLSAANARIDPWAALAGLKLPSDEKAYLHGVLNILQLPDELAHELLARYRDEWERAAKRCTNHNGIHNAGYRAANLWLQQGAPGFILWEGDG